MKFSSVHWGGTALLAVMRLAAASVVISILTIPMAVKSGGNIGEMLALPLAALVFLGMCISIALLGALLDKLGVPFAGILVIAGFFVVIGDPLVWTINKFKPGMLPVEEFGFLNRPILFVSK